VVIKGEDRNVLLSALRAMRWCGSPEEMEAETCLEGLRLAAKWIRVPALVELDCENVIKALKGERGNPSTTCRVTGVIVEIHL
jgi:hypothetical protein